MVSSSSSDHNDEDTESFKNVVLITEDGLPCRFSKNHRLNCPDHKVSDYAGAKSVFLAGRESALNLTSEINEINNSSFVLAKQFSSLYDILAFYEGLQFIRENTYNRISKMHKRRITLWKSMIAKNTLGSHGGKILLLLS